MNTGFFTLRMDSESGLRLPLSRRHVVAALGVGSALARDEASWVASLEEGAHAPLESVITCDTAGVTYLRHLSGSVNATQLARLMKYVHNAIAGDSVVIDIDGRTSLWVAGGSGLAAEHQASVVFPTFAGEASRMPVAIAQYEQALDDSVLMASLDVVDAPRFMPLHDAADDGSGPTRSLHG